MTRRASALVAVAATALTAVGLLTASAFGAAAASGPAIELPAPFTLKVWQPTSDNVYQAKGRLLFDGRPVAGARMRVDLYTLDTPTDRNGAFTYPVDATLAAVHRVSVGNADAAKIDGKAPTQSQRNALLENANGVITVAFGITGLKAEKQKNGTFLVTGRVAYADGKTPPPPVTIYTYQLSGTITDATGQPVTDAIVSTRTLDRSFWTISQPSDARGRYTSLFTASAEQPGNPVPLDIRVAKGDDIYEFLAGEHVTFQRLQSARMDIQLPPAGFAMALPVAHSFPGAVYEGLVVGVASGAKVVDPVSAIWPTKDGRFSLTLPASLGGRKISLWERRSRVFLTTAAKPGAAIEKDVWPARVPVDAEAGVASLTLPR